MHNIVHLSTGIQINTACKSSYQPTPTSHNTALGNWKKHNPHFVPTRTLHNPHIVPPRSTRKYHYTAQWYKYKRNSRIVPPMYQHGHRTTRHGDQDKHNPHSVQPIQKFNTKQCNENKQKIVQPSTRRPQKQASRYAKWQSHAPLRWGVNQVISKPRNSDKKSWL